MFNPFDSAVRSAQGSFSGSLAERFAVGFVVALALALVTPAASLASGAGSISGTGAETPMTTLNGPHALAAAAAGSSDPAIAPGSGWTEFEFGEVGAVDFAGAFNFTSSSPTVVSVVDSYLCGDEFEVFDNGTSIGRTSQVNGTTCPTPGSADIVGEPETAFTDPAFSKGSFRLGPGSHSVTIVPTVAPWNEGAAYLRVAPGAGSSVPPRVSTFTYCTPRVKPRAMTTEVDFRPCMRVSDAYNGSSATTRSVTPPTNSRRSGGCPSYIAHLFSSLGCEVTKVGHHSSGSGTTDYVTMKLSWATSTDGYAVLITELEEDTLTLSVTTSATGARTVSSAVALDSHQQIVTQLDIGFFACRDVAVASGGTCTRSVSLSTSEQDPAPADAAPPDSASHGTAERDSAPADATPTGEITGKVSDALGEAAIEGIEVCALTSAEEFAGCSSTSPTGEYTISGLATGSYKVEFYGDETCEEDGCTQQNYVTQYYDNGSTFSGAEGVSVTDGGTTSGIDAEMVEGGMITGQVTSASGGAPIEGIEVCALTSREESANCAYTNSSGEYTISGLGAGSYKVEFYSFSNGYLTQYYDDATSFSGAEGVSVTGTGTTSGIDAEMVEGGMITGQVTSASGGAPIAGIEVCALTSAEEFAGCSSTSLTGEYTISGLSTGSYKVEFYSFSNGYLTQYYDDGSSFNEAEGVSVTDGGTTSGIDAEMVEGGKIAGQVTSASGGAPIEGIEVCAESAGDKRSAGCAYTNSNGEYTISGLSTGSYKVEFYGAEACGEDGCTQQNYVTQYYDVASISGAEGVSVTDGGTTSGIDAEMVEGGKIAGQVTSASGGAPIEGIEVCAESASDKGSANCAHTDPTGEYTISSLREGSYKVRFYGAEACGENGCTQQNFITQYYEDEASFSGAEGVSVTGTGTTSGIDARMVEGGMITGKVTSASGGAPIEGIEVCALTSAEEYAGCSYTSSAGEYTIAGLSMGSYEVGFLMSPESGLDYTTQYYNDKFSYSEAEPVSVTAGSATPNIDAELQPATAMAPENTKLPEITGTPAAGDTLNCSIGTWTGTPMPTYTYKWLRDGSPISGDVSSSYKVQPADEGHTLSCEVTATNTAGSKAATSYGVAVPAAKQGVLGAKEGSPNATIADTSLKVGASGKFVVEIICPSGEASCTGTITLRTEHAVGASVRGNVAKRKHKATVLTLASGSFTVTGGQSKKITLHLTAAGRKLLAHNHVLSARVTIVAHDPTGGTHTGQTIVTLRVSKPEHGKH